MESLLSTPIQSLFPREMFEEGRVSGHARMLLAYDQSPLMKGEKIRAIGTSTKRLLNYESYTSIDKKKVIGEK